MHGDPCLLMSMKENKGPSQPPGALPARMAPEREGQKGWVFLAPGTGQHRLQGSGKGAVWWTHQVCRRT